MLRNNAQAYEAVTRQALEGRELEASVLLKAARKLKDCSERWDEATSGHREQLAEALRYNQKLWTIFQADITDPASSLPRELRRNLLSLSRFVDSSTFAILAEPDRGRLEALVRLNMTIAEGLLEPPPAQRSSETDRDSCGETLDVAL